LPSRSWRSRLSVAALLIVLAALATGSVHRETLGYGFDYDDYYFLHPSTLDDVLATFHGPWDRTGVMVTFYRPLTVAFSALRFELFGLNSVAHHALSLTMFAVAGILAATLVYAVTGRVLAAILATLFFVCHPAMPYSLVAWVTNQMHLQQILVVLAALLWAHAVRRRTLIWWLPLLLFAAAAFAIKEDGIMLLPSIVALHQVKRLTTERDLPRAPAAFLIVSVLLLAALMWLRSQFLGELGGYSRLSLQRGWTNVSGAVYGVYRLIPADRDWQPLASAFATWLPLLAVAAWRWISQAARWCLMGGAAIAILFAAPFVFAVKPEQVYMLGLGYAIVLTGAAIGGFDLAARTVARSAAAVLVAGIVIAALASFTAVTRAITRDFEPFGPLVLGHDDIVRTWGSVPAEIKDYLERKRAAGASARPSPNVLDELDVATFNTHGRDVTPDGVPYMWMARTWCEIDIAANAREVTIPLRHEIGIFRDPAHVRIEADGRLADELTLTSSEWRHSTIALRRATVPRLGRMHRIRITLNRVWRPMDIIPGSQDGRALGLQVGTPSIR
jgi:hypothetical protein